MSAEHLAVQSFDCAWLCRQILGQKFRKGSFTYETNTGTVFFIVHGKRERFRELSNLILAQSRQWKQRTTECGLRNGAQKITLIFVRIRCFEQTNSRRMFHMRVMAGRD